MTIHKSYPFNTQNKIFETNHQPTHPVNQPAVELPSPMMDEQFRQYLQYRSLEYRGQPGANPEALIDLDRMMGDLNDYGTDFLPAEIPSSETANVPVHEQLSPTEARKEVKVLRKELDRVKDEIRKAGLDSDTEGGFMDRLTELYGRLYDKKNPLDPEGIRNDLATLKDDLDAAVTEKKANDEAAAAKAAAAKETDSENTGGVDTSDDTPPDTKTGNVWNYSGYGANDVTLHAVKGHDSKINVTGDVDIKLSVGQTAEVKKDSGNYIVTVSDEKGAVTTFTVNSSAKSLNIDGPPSVIKLDGDLASDPKVQIQGTSASGTQQTVDNYVTALQNSINSGSLFKDKGSLYCDNGDWKNDWAKKALQDLTNGLKNNDWTALQSDLNAVMGQHGSGDQNDCVELLFLGIYGSLGGNSNEAKAVFAKLPADVRGKLTQALSAEKGELANDDLKNHMKGSWSGSYFGPGGTFQTHQDAVDFINSSSSTSSTPPASGSSK